MHAFGLEETCLYNEAKKQAERVIRYLNIITPNNKTPFIKQFIMNKLLFSFDYNFYSY